MVPSTTVEPTTSAPAVLLTRNAAVARITLNRPERRNALSESLVDELLALLAQIADDRTIRVVELAAAGTVFCAGHDLAEMTGRSESEYQTLFSRCARLMQRLRSIPQPVIAVVQGLATGAGCQLVAGCDLVVASDAARFATPGVKLGLFCTTPMVPLVRSIPPKVALEMLFTGAVLSAQRAYEIGLVNRVVPAAELDAAVATFSQSIVESSPMTIALGKRAFYDQLELSETDAYRTAVPVMVSNAVANDAQEGMSAFVEKRKPVWTGT